ncbi:MAG: M15 family metallopeptidase [Proteobacteria bacterium]|nr:M15 family metallopeptidase [Pseudomonadota bacterium]MBU1709127.1 M15 family metallopeptidase [Pseudomonadota bacterium]
MKWEHNSLVETDTPAEEFVTINGETYPVQLPWKGHVFGIKDNPKSMDLVKVPIDFSFEESKIYVTRKTRDAFVRMANAAALEGIELKVDSGYRSMYYQRQVFMRLIAKGKTFEEIAGRGTAPPGYSEHMLGIAFDMVPSNSSFVKTESRKWLEGNAHKFCFEESYPEDLRDGFLWEPWHWRYTGCDT